MTTAVPATGRDAGHIQGGDTTALPEDTVDLSACSNRLGPPPHAVQALIDFLAEHPEQLVHPPYESDDRRSRRGRRRVREVAEYRAHKRYLATYAAHLRRRSPAPAGIDLRDMVAGRGVTEHLYVLARLLHDQPVAVITPEYTGTLQQFGGFADFIGPEPSAIDTAELRLERIRRAASSDRYRYVIFSNPNNPCGHFIEPAALLEICARAPHATLIVDEEYGAYQGDFGVSLIGADCENLVVLQSSGKPYGITGGSRAGMLWTRQESLRAAVAAQIPRWPLSIPEIVLACAALEDDSWLLEQMTRARADAHRLQNMLGGCAPGTVAPGATIHYRLLVHDDPLALHGHLLRRGINTRALTLGPGRVSGLRISTPHTPREFDQLHEGLNTLSTWTGRS